MPEIVVYLAEGRSAEQKRKLLRSLTDAAVRDLGVRPAAVVVQIVETPRTDKARGGVPFDELAAARSADPDLSDDDIIAAWSRRQGRGS